MEWDHLDAAKLQGQSLGEAEDCVEGCTVLVNFQCYQKHGLIVWTISGRELDLESVWIEQQVLS